MQIHNKQTKRIMVFSGKRGGYGALKPLLRLINNEPSLELDLVLSSTFRSNTLTVDINLFSLSFLLFSFSWGFLPRERTNENGEEK